MLLCQDWYLTIYSPPIIPFLFVTIACGAISGFHGLIASGTTSKQISNIQDTKMIGYGSMLGEGTLALASTIAAVAGISLVTNCNLPSIGAVDNLNWNLYYDTWAHAATNKATAFVLGGGALLQKLGLPPMLAKTLMAVLVISFAGTLIPIDKAPGFKASTSSPEAGTTRVRAPGQ